MDEQVSKPRTSLPVVIEPEPMPHRAGTLGALLASLGMVAVVVVVLYGLSRPNMPPQTAGAPNQSAPSQTGQPAPAGGQGQQAARPEPSTTGQGQSQSGEPEKQQPASGKRERSDSVTIGAQPGDRSRPQQQ